jgi:hypothetical protein
LAFKHADAIQKMHLKIIAESPAGEMTKFEELVQPAAQHPKVSMGMM